MEDMKIVGVDIKKPQYKWKCCLFGLREEGIILNTNCPPFILWRWMQYLLIGNRWEKIKLEKENKK